MLEPRRLVDRVEQEQAGGSELGDALRQARAASGDGERVARLWQRVGDAAAASAGGSASGSASGSGAGIGHAGAGLSAIKGVMLGVVAVFGVLGAGYFVWGQAEGGREQVRRAPAPVQAKAVAVQRERTRAQAPDMKVQLGEVVSEEREDPTVVARPKHRQTARGEPRRGERSRARAAKEPARPMARAVMDPDAELALLTRAEQAMPAQPRASLAVLHEHAQRFPEGVLAQEREVLRIDAELALGLRAQAAARARAFIARFPDSAHRHRFESLLAVHAESNDERARDRKIDAQAIPTD